MITVAIHQPEYWPCLALCAKAARADLLVLLDDVQFNRASLQHRARLATADGMLRWLTLPFIHAFPQRIDRVEIADLGYSDRHARVIADCYGPRVADGVYARCERLVADVTVRTMQTLFGALGIETPMMRASTIGAPGHRGEHVLAICKAVGADRYLSGRAGATYLDRAAFRDAGIEIAVSTFTAPDYRRPTPLPPEAHAHGLSGLDVVAHLGSEARGWFRTALGAAP